jgi:hypothetical protein
MVVYVLAGTSTGTIHYQWQRSTDAGVTWPNLTGKTSATLSQASTWTDEAALFRCQVSDDVDSIYSDVATAAITSAAYTLADWGVWLAWPYPGYGTTVQASGKNPSGYKIPYVGRTTPEDGGVGYRMLLCTTAGSTIPSKAVTGGTIALPLYGAYGTESEFGTMEAYLAPAGWGYSDTAAYDVAGLTKVGSGPANEFSRGAITLDGAALSALVGRELAFVFASSTERDGSGSVAAYVYSRERFFTSDSGASAVLTLTF